MTGDSSGAGDGLMMGTLSTLDRAKILDVLSGSEGFCQHCQTLLQSRIHTLIHGKFSKPLSVSNENGKCSAEVLSEKSSRLNLSDTSPEESTKTTSWRSGQTPKSVHSGRWTKNNPESVCSGTGRGSVDELSEEQKEHVRLAQIGSRKDFVHVERVNGKATNVLRGLELHTGVFNAEEQKMIVECVYSIQRKGQSGQLRARTYSEPHKWMRGKGRVTMQFGCCYNYALDKKGNPPGIVRDEEVDPLPPLFKEMIRRLVRWHVLPPSCVPDSCIVNIYDEGDCIPPHIDNHDFLRPFCTVSFLSECNILFGVNLNIVGPGEFAGPISIPLPLGSVLVLNGNAADIAKHCVPGVPARRISITFRKMDESRRPYSYSPDPDLMGIKPLGNHSSTKFKLPFQQEEWEKKTTMMGRNASMIDTTTTTNTNSYSHGDFPPLGSSNPGNRQRGKRK
ncbi:RNA demethylase ALKBH9B-like [Diospyros lotus]|uniref:RNA demethylase ALKBH9B-like n=1 Tax=Diospyros lotus TaxID=55363 RepID=UPI00225B2042|nr:RNA demethylase ALKBH9B-like [Diospyros lotus]